ncbi:hypothetical protein ACP275_06G166400 [Erythranthe tilingii]
MCARFSLFFFNLIPAIRRRFFTPTKKTPLLRQLLLTSFRPSTSTSCFRRCRLPFTCPLLLVPPLLLFSTHKNLRRLLPAAHYFPPETPPTKPLQFAAATAAAVKGSYTADSWRRDKIGLLNILIFFRTNCSSYAEHGRFFPVFFLF